MKAFRGHETTKSRSKLIIIVLGQSLPNIALVKTAGNHTIRSTFISFTLRQLGKARKAEKANNP